MIKNKTVFILLHALTISLFSFAQTNKMPTDFLKVPGPINFDGKAYNLNWASHPTTAMYKQEYLVKGDNADRFNTMILLDVIVGEITMKATVANKVAELKKMKESNPVVNYEVIENPKTGEYMIDFLVLANAADGSISILERNVYRYKIFTDKAGHKGVLLFGVSVRCYGAGVTAFLTSLKSNRKELTSKVAQYKLPEVTLMN